MTAIRARWARCRCGTCAARYTGFKNLTLTLGVKNLFDTDPPLTNQDNDVPGRLRPVVLRPARPRFVYGSLTYSFK